MKELTQFYKVDVFGNIDYYEYLCVHPNHKEYHIVLKMGAYPERMYTKEFNNVFFDKEEAKLKAIEYLEYQIKLIKEP